MSVLLRPGAWLFAALITAILAIPAYGQDGATVSGSGHYGYTEGNLPQMAIYYYLPDAMAADAPILFVIPGAQRNADDYRDAWIKLADTGGFAVMALECSLVNCPTEYSYNAGGVTDAKGKIQPEDTWLFSALDPAFEDFKIRTGLSADRYVLYGHSAGGSFVHMFMLFKPGAKVSRAVSANAAFFAMPNTGEPYPFGLKGMKVTKAEMRDWLSSDLTIMLGDQDIGPRTKKLSNSAKGIAQGPSVFARGLLFFHGALSSAAQLDMETAWILHVVHGVGHSNTNMAPHAVPFLFDPVIEADAP